MKLLYRLKEKSKFTYGINFEEETFCLKKNAVGQLLASSLQLNFKGEIKCFKKRLNLDNGPQGKKSANGQICNIGVGRGVAGN